MLFWTKRTNVFFTGAIGTCSCPQAMLSSPSISVLSEEDSKLDITQDAVPPLTSRLSSRMYSTKGNHCIGFYLYCCFLFSGYDLTTSVFVS